MPQQEHHDNDLYEMVVVAITVTLLALLVWGVFGLLEYACT